MSVSTKKSAKHKLTSGRGVGTGQKPRRTRRRPVAKARSRDRSGPEADSDAAVLEPAGDEDERPTTARNENSADEDRSSFLAMYFREMAALDVLKPEQEFETARELEALEVVIWEQVFSYASAVDHVCRQVEAQHGGAFAPFRALRRSAAKVKTSPTKANRSHLAKTAHAVAQKLRAEDQDRELLTAVVAELVRIRRRGFSDEMSPRPRFSPTSNVFGRYVDRVRAADREAERCRSAFVKANLRLVVSIARRFNHGRMSLADLIQEGNIGLMKAVERYDYTKGFRFSTYASWWIRHAISRALADKGREVRLPVHMIDAQHRIAKARRQLSARLGRQPTAEELAAVTDIAAAKIEKMRTYLVDQSFSLDRPVNDEDGRNFVEFLPDPAFEEEPATDRLTAEVMTREVRALLAELKPIEADILRRRFGFEHDEELTLKEIGQRYNLSRERIRQLQEQALSKMRRALDRKDLL